MRKCNVVAAYHNTSLMALTVITREGIHVELYRSTNDSYSFETFNDMYGTVLKILNNNGFYTDFYPAFGRESYNILWYDTHNPTYHQRFGFNRQAWKG